MRDVDEPSESRATLCVVCHSNSPGSSPQLWKHWYLCSPVADDRVGIVGLARHAEQDRAGTWRRRRRRGIRDGSWGVVWVGVKVE